MPARGLSYQVLPPPLLVLHAMLVHGLAELQLCARIVLLVHRRQLLDLHQLPLVVRASQVHGRQLGPPFATFAMLEPGHLPVVLRCAIHATRVHILALGHYRVCCVNLGHGLPSAKPLQALNVSHAIAAPFPPLGPRHAVPVRPECIQI